MRIDSLTTLFSNGTLGAEAYWIGQNDRAVYHTRRPWMTTPPTDSVFLWFPHPVLKGETGLDGYATQWLVSAVDTVIHTPAGSFSSVRYDYPAREETYFVAPGIGVVRKLFVSDRRRDSQGQYIYLVRGIISLTAVEGITR